MAEHLFPPIAERLSVPRFGEAEDAAGSPRSFPALYLLSSGSKSPGNSPGGSLSFSGAGEVPHFESASFPSTPDASLSASSRFWTCCDASVLLSLQLLYLCVDVYQQMSPKEARALGKDIWHIFLDKTAVSVWPVTFPTSCCFWHSCCAHTCPIVWFLSGAWVGRPQERETPPSVQWNTQKSP